MSLTHRAARTLFARTWPGNVRELERALELALVAAADGPIELASLSGSSVSSDPGPAPRAARRPPRAELEALLSEHSGNVAAVARRLGKAREQVYRWIRNLGVDPASYRD